MLAFLLGISGAGRSPYHPRGATAVTQYSGGRRAFSLSIFTAAGKLQVRHRAHLSDEPCKAWWDFSESYTRCLWGESHQFCFTTSGIPAFGSGTTARFHQALVCGDAEELDLRGYDLFSFSEALWGDRLGMAC